MAINSLQLYCYTILCGLLTLEAWQLCCTARGFKGSDFIIVLPEYFCLQIALYVPYVLRYYRYVKSAFHFFGIIDFIMRVPTY